MISVAMRRDQRMDRLHRHGAFSNLVGKRREAEVNPFARIAFALSVQWLMLAKLLKQDHGEQVWAGKAARRHMEGCRGVRDLLALAAGELLPHRLDHLPGSR